MFSLTMGDVQYRVKEVTALQAMGTIITQEAD